MFAGDQLKAALAASNEANSFWRFVHWVIACCNHDSDGHIEVPDPEIPRPLAVTAGIALRSLARSFTYNTDKIYKYN